MHIHLLRTRYPHWSQYSGISQYVRYLNSEQYTVDMKLVSDSDEDFPITDPIIQTWLRGQVQSRGMQWYKLSDLTAEFKAFVQDRQKKFDVIHYLDGEHSAQFLPKLLQRFPGKRPKLVATYHQPPELLDSLIDKQVIPLLDFITVVCPEQADYFSQFTDAHKVRSILHGIDTTYFKPGNELKTQKKFRCITVGQWLRDYKAFRQVAETLSSNSNIEFHVVSGNAIGLEGLSNVRVYRGIDDASLLKLYQQSDVLFLPLENSTANNALLEGIACGLPVISTDLASVRAYLPGSEAILIQNNHCQELVEAIMYLFDNQTAREKMSMAARQRAEELDWKNIATSYEDVYSKLVFHR